MNQNTMPERFASKFMEKFGDQLLNRLAENQTLLNSLEGRLTLENTANGRISGKRLNSLKINPTQSKRSKGVRKNG